MMGCSLFGCWDSVMSAIKSCVITCSRCSVAQLGLERSDTLIAGKLRTALPTSFTSTPSWLSTRGGHRDRRFPAHTRLLHRELGALEASLQRGSHAPAFTRATNHPGTAVIATATMLIAAKLRIAIAAPPAKTTGKPVTLASAWLISSAP
jgi:hypothetical protein